MTTKLSAQLLDEARKVIPGGVNSPVRAWKAVGGVPRFIQRGAGSTVTDVDGTTFVDYVGSWGALILGHAHPAVLKAIGDVMRAGTSFGAPTPREVEMAIRLTSALPALEQVRLVCSGTEATMTAIRLARAFTRRPKIVKFDGCYHGHVDALLIRAGSGAMTFGVPDSDGIPEATISQTLVACFNDVDEIDARFAAEGETIAAVIVEPVVGNMGVVPPQPDYLQRLRQITADHGAFLIFDEVITGFRLAWGGVQNLLDIRPDLTCLGKIIGGGLPLAAVGGRTEVMQQLAPQGSVYQAGTLAGNPLAVAAGLATLNRLDRPMTYDRLEELGARLEAGLASALRRTGRRGCINRRGSMWTLFFGVETVRNACEARAADTGAYARFFAGMVERGVLLPPSQFESAFISLAHSDDDIERTIRAAEETLAAMPAGDGT
jgi:glutamate-1-semialdehyde 2,1-aminomutase